MASEREGGPGRGLFDLSGKAALVTGGNSGLGLGFARGLARQGADLMLWARDAAKNERAAEELRAFGGRVLTEVVDVASEAAVTRGIEAAVAKLGRLDCVIANAGISSRASSVLELETKAYHDLLDVNLHGAFYTLREGARHMVARAKAGDPGGSLIVCGSLTVFRGVPGLTHYGAAKGALASIVKNMAMELGRYGVRVNMVAPGKIKTDLSRGKPSPNDQVFLDRTPIPRHGYPEDFEGIIAYLASDAASFHTGDIITIDGGWMAAMF